jgi:hypothetical protein
MYNISTSLPQLSKISLLISDQRYIIRLLACGFFTANFIFKKNYAFVYTLSVGLILVPPPQGGHNSHLDISASRASRKH